MRWGRPWGAASFWGGEPGDASATQEQWTTVLLKLLPKGPAWTRRLTASATELLRGLAGELARVSTIVAQLYREIDPRKAEHTLDLWEADLGIPGKCGARAVTLSDRQAAAYAKLTFRGGQEAEASFGEPDEQLPLYRKIANDLGYELTIIEFTTQTGFMRCDSRCDSKVSGHWNPYCWIIETPSQGSTLDAVLECMIREHVHEHTRLKFRFT